MLFNSYVFILLFLPITLIGFYLIARVRHALANGFLAAASFFFYGWWDVRYVPLLCVSIGWNYLIARGIESASGARRRGLLALGICGNVALLGYYKYAGFFVSSLDSALGLGYEIPHIILPLGISFYTFTQTAYLVDAYRGETRRYSLLDYTLFVTIFPHLIAGPIINHRDMIPQFQDVRHFIIDHKKLAIGLALFVLGLGKKVLIADNLSPWVGAFFTHADSLSFIEAWTGALAYTYQLYFDFSGYSEMAIGLGLMLGLRFPTNFNSPYKSRSIIDFWRRWHMTLGLWVKNYLYIPLGGNRHGELKKMRNLLVSMLVIGLWHGAGWTFVLWGGAHGILLVLNHQWRRLKIALPSPICWLLTFVAVVFCWVFFRADSLADGCAIAGAMLGLGGDILGYDTPGGPGRRYIWPTLLALTIVLLKCPNPPELLRSSFRPNKRWLLIIALLAAIELASLTQVSEFLYFQF